MLVVNSWINSRFVMAGVVREVLISWSCRAVDTMCERGDSGAVEENSAVSHSLAYLVPHEAAISALLRGVWHALVRPAMRHTDVAMCQLDGCVWLDDRARCLIETALVCLQTNCSLGRHVQRSKGHVCISGITSGQAFIVRPDSYRFAAVQSSTRV